MAVEHVAWALRVLGRDEPPDGREDEAWAWWSGEGLLAHGGTTYRGSNGIMEVEGYASEVGGVTDRLAVSIGAAFGPLRLSLLREVGEELVEVKWLRETPPLGWQEVTGVRFVGRIGQSRLVDGVFRAELESLQLGEQLPYGAWDDEGQQSRSPRDLAFSRLAGGIAGLDAWAGTTDAPVSTDRNPGELPELPPFPVPVILPPGREQPQGTPPKVNEGGIPRQFLGAGQRLRLDLRKYFTGHFMVFSAVSDDPGGVRVSAPPNTNGWLLDINRVRRTEDATVVRVRARNRWGAVEVPFSVEMDAYDARFGRVGVRNLEVNQISTTNANLSWSPPFGVLPAGAAAFFEVALRKVGETDWRHEYTHLAYSARYTPVGNMEPDTLYEARLRIRVENPAGTPICCGPASVYAFRTAKPAAQGIVKLGDPPDVVEDRLAPVSRRLWLTPYYRNFIPGTTIVVVRSDDPTKVSVGSGYLASGAFWVRVSFTASADDYSVPIRCSLTNPGTGLTGFPVQCGVPCPVLVSTGRRTPPRTTGRGTPALRCPCSDAVCRHVGSPVPPSFFAGDAEGKTERGAVAIMPTEALRRRPRRLRVRFSEKRRAGANLPEGRRSRSVRCRPGVVPLRRRGDGPATGW